MNQFPSNNPFFFGGIATGEHFCDRDREMQSLRKDLENGLNLLIYAPRRFGKTSLICKTLRQMKQRSIFMDLMGLTDENEFINEYFNAISRSLSTTTDKIIAFFKKSLKIRPNISVDFDQTGNPRFALQFSITEQANVLREVLDIPYQLALRNKERIVVVFDEFQEIQRLGFENKLRSVIQHHGDKVAYLFSGSKKSVMARIFFDKSKAFYRSVKHLPIQPIENLFWIDYIQKGFRKYNKSIKTEQILKILEISRGFPYYTQQIAYELFNISSDECRDDLIGRAVTAILDRDANLFLLEWENLSTNQKKALKLLIKSDGKNIYRKEIMEQFRLTNSTLKKAIEGLITKDVIDVNLGVYYLQDPIFLYYMKTRF